MRKCRSRCCERLESDESAYCKVCEGFLPICPICDAPYGEHALSCPVTDGYLDCGEGPFVSRDQATRFGDAEVGAQWEVHGAAGQWYVMVKERS